MPGNNATIIIYIYDDKECEWCFLELCSAHHAQPHILALQTSQQLGS